MSYYVQKAAVLGAGVMGSGIAGLLASVGIRVVLLDVVPNELTEEEKGKGLTKESPQFRNKFAIAALERILNPKTMMLYKKESAALINTGNMTDNMDMISDCDWIIEVVVERLDIKKQVMKEVEKHRRPGSIVSTNTSGVSIREITKDMPKEFRQHFLGTHFFNPPRFMRLFEMIVLEDTLPEVKECIVNLARNTLGKGVVFAKDTPNFIGNRIASMSSAEVLRLMIRYDFTIPLVDQLTGEVMGKAKSATFGTADLVGIDVFTNVAGNVINSMDDPKEKELFTHPGFVHELVKAGALGNKTKHGFYKRISKKESMYWDYKEKEYKPYLPTVPEAVKKALASDNKFAAIVYGEAPENKFIWDHTKALLLYSSAKVPEITEDFKMIDKAMKWGYNWEKGPFQIWDAIDPQRSIARMKDEGESVPAWVEQHLKDNGGCFYNKDTGIDFAYINLSNQGAPPVAANEDATLRDIGDGVLCLEFHSKGNSISDKTMEMLRTATEELKKDWIGLVIGNRSKNFSAGANLVGIATLAKERKWDSISEHVKVLQSVNMALKYAPKPVVAAPYGMTVGGGAECVLHSSYAVPHAELYMGLVEVGVGLVPSGGGCKECLLRSAERAGGATSKSLLPVLRSAWRGIVTGSVSANAFDAVDKGFLRQETRIILNPDALIDEAKKSVIELASKGYLPPKPSKVLLLGDYGRAVFFSEIEGMRGGGYMSEYDMHIAKKIAFILTGGNAVNGTLADEQYILDLEREAFVSLCGEEKTQERIEYMLNNGKPLRN
ncbi:3-hydroxyacyl-CoA dehydrogenase [Desulfitobacterium dichloroeliminans LMG P-21439]|uniref:3-hydroxyacyl-CoA dehydrogenase n=1 Tax=Desulfitobacterium dichloroeliminans (strain LMG P-21439 / DCA1) TaxID=871963 RepID=L0F6H1_DESDL|nr:3-hydroxyacyl-CoA dehydrogenase/enoyl-CoA hydratase family protein [Desulfitobacterium dichloroeliminans]AGA68256.1 3-hydroxyacyl-CoA dehydrogenase [Desulfitobacterium dichloroeliminans LMG P-21439]